MLSVWIQYIKRPQKTTKSWLGSYRISSGKEEEEEEAEEEEEEENRFEVLFPRLRSAYFIAFFFAVLN